eukprot:13144226-Heterocapsa_arctica.AAC.1
MLAMPRVRAMGDHLLSHVVLPDVAEGKVHHEVADRLRRRIAGAAGTIARPSEPAGATGNQTSTSSSDCSIASSTGIGVALPAAAPSG